jgi:hypothetical protein
VSSGLGVISLTLYTRHFVSPIKEYSYRVVLMFDDEFMLISGQVDNEDNSWNRVQYQACTAALRNAADHHKARPRTCTLYLMNRDLLYHPENTKCTCML